MKMKITRWGHSPVALGLLLLLAFINLICFGESVITSRNETDRLALVAFKAGISDDPNRVLSSWNDSLHFCRWRGVTCSKRHPQRVAALNLTGQGLVGSLSPYITNLSFLRSINLSDNKLEGRIPEEIGHLFRLSHLDLANNSFVGEIPKNLTHCLQLRVVRFYRNELVGKIPLEIGSLSKLYTLILAKNKLTGHIPPSVGNLSSLEVLYLSENDLGGSIPDELGRLVNLHGLGLYGNIHSGTIPSALYNLSLIRFLDVGGNHLYGSLPPDLGLIFSNLEGLYVGVNKFTGSIPVSLGNASRLVHLDFVSNSFTGSMPINLGRLKGLKYLNVGKNQLVNEKHEEFTLLSSLTNCSGLQVLCLNDNQFSGMLPKSTANLSTNLTDILLGRNQISGAIPTGFESLTNLIRLAMGDNLLTGTIPIHLMKLKNLQVLSLHGNKLSGKIPISIGNLTELFLLSLNRNDLYGSIPWSLGNCQNLQLLFLSDNNLNGTIPNQVLDIPSLLKLHIERNNLKGSLPMAIGKSKNIFLLAISNNRLSGEIPSILSSCLSLEYLYMDGNLLNGSIPPSLSALRGLQVLDLSRNNFSGHIPSILAQLPFLQYLNLSFNNLDGDIPQHGIFQNASAISIIGNSKLCGGIPKLQLPKCPKYDFEKQERPLSQRVIISVVVAVVLFLFLLLGFWAILSKKLKEKISSISSMRGNFLKVTYGELFKATNGFSSTNLIGVGSYGSVYKGIVDRMEMIVAIKVLRLQKERALKSFVAECRALRSIQHRNIVKILTACSSIDFSGNDFKALVLQYMPNGSLDSWLHPSENEVHQLKTLSLIQRLNVAIDVACALDYLHHHCQPSIVHCDLKPSNILLDDDMVAHVGDFGLARVLSEDINNSRSQTNSLAVKGSIGYVAPEYGMGANTSTYGDLYSYGILLLEMFTGKRPTDDMFNDNLTLHQFAKMALPERVMEITDPRLLSEEIETIRQNQNHNKIRSIMDECLVSVVTIGVSCSDDSPKERMEMKDVIIKLHKVRGFYLGAEK